MLAVVLFDPGLRIEAQDLRIGPDVELPERGAGELVILALLERFQIAVADPRRHCHVVERGVSIFPFHPDALAHAGHREKCIVRAEGMERLIPLLNESAKPTRRHYSILALAWAG